MRCGAPEDRRLVHADAKAVFLSSVAAKYFLAKASDLPSLGGLTVSRRISWFARGTRPEMRCSQSDCLAIAGSKPLRGFTIAFDDLFSVFAIFYCISMIPLLILV